MSRLLSTADQFAHGKLEQLVRTERAKNKSFEAIAQELAVEHDIRVSGETVRMWARDLGLPDPKDAA